MIFFKSTTKSILRNSLLSLAFASTGAILGSIVVPVGPAMAQSSMNWECRVEGSNKGCDKVIQAPTGKKIVSVKAACNLEFGEVSDNQLAAVSSNKLKVVKKSDRKLFRPNGNCYVNSTKISSKSKTIQNVDGVTHIKVGCFEHDKNGGDCHIKGVARLQDGPGQSPRETFTYSTSLSPVIPHLGVVPYFHLVNPGRGAKLEKVKITGGIFTNYVVQFLPSSSDRSECGSDVGVRVEPGKSLDADGLGKLFGSKTPATPVQLYACKLSRVSQPIDPSGMPVSVTYFRIP